MSKRKVLFLMTDSQRADMLGCYGNSDMHTPNLDRLAEQGIRFDKAYTTQPLCQPANGIWTEAIISALADVRRAGMQITGMT